MEAIAIAIVALLILALTLGPKLHALATDRPSDISTIKAAFEGIQGKAGPNMTVVSVTRSGTDFGGRYSAPARKYQVVLRGFDGREHRRTVSVTAGIVDDGELQGP